MVKVIKNKKLKNKITAAIMAGLICISSTVSYGGQSSSKVYADQYDEKIKALQQEIDAASQKAAEAASRGDTLQTKLDELNGQLSTLKNQIAINQNKQSQIADEIAVVEAKLIENKKLLASSLKQLYRESTVTSLEMLASSSNLSDYIDKQEQLNKTQTQVANLTDEAEALKVSLQSQKQQIDNLLQDQQNIKVTLAEKQAETDKLLTETKGEESAYQTQVAAKNSEVEAQRAAQKAANEAALTPVGGGGTGITISPGSGDRGGYPDIWHNAPQDSLVDSWGMYNRECVSYTAYKVAASGRYMPYWGGYGNANQWPANAINAGIPVDSNPRVGDVAVSMAGYYGHVMYVEEVYSNGTIKVSQYNYGVTGEYSEMVISSSGLRFIHFP
jgi:surface antigen/peptidoglycan hydrolase CwlO-like protein